MKKFSNIDIKEKTYVDIIKEDIYNAIKENIKVISNNDNEQDISIVIDDIVINKISDIINNERINERIATLEQFKNIVMFSGVDLQRINEEIETLKNKI